MNPSGDEINHARIGVRQGKCRPGDRQPYRRMVENEDELSGERFLRRKFTNMEAVMVGTRYARKSIGDELTSAPLSAVDQSVATTPIAGDWVKPRPWLAHILGHAGDAADSSDADTVLPDPSPNPIQPDFYADNFSSLQPIDNPYFPFHVGTIFTFGSLPDEEDPEETSNATTCFTAMKPSRFWASSRLSCAIRPM
jgi:hypothetical protein